MAKGKYYCEECVEEISQGDVFWENGRAYCGRCGGELDLDEEAVDVVEHITTRKGRSPIPATPDEDEDEKEEDLDGADLDEEDEDEDNEPLGELDEDLDEDEDDGRPRR
jgi:hypothetical protein